MKNPTIEVSQNFIKQFKKLPKEVQIKAVKCQQLFSANPFHPGLRLHKLKGILSKYWRISIDMKYRIIFTYTDDNTVLFINIGSHSIYYTS